MENKTIARGCLGFFTLSCAGFSMATLAVGVSKILEGGPDIGANVGAFIFFLTLFSFFSFATYKIFSKKKVVSNPQDIERQALSFAHQKEGYVSVADLALHAQISVDEAGAILDELVLQNVARVEVSGSGKLVYLFDAFMGVEGSKKDTLEIAIENARAATANLKKKRAAEEAAAAVELHIEVNADVDHY